MTTKFKNDWNPFLSVLIMIFVGIACVFIKMEVVREGYETLRVGKALKIELDNQSRLEAQFAKLTRPSRLDKIGTQKLALAKLQKNQVVMMAGQGEVAVRQ
jgi:hypothetical protein